MLKIRIVFLLFVFAAFAATARAQGDPFVLGNVQYNVITGQWHLVVYGVDTVVGAGGGGGLSFVSSLPATCAPGVTASVELSVAPYTINYCSAPNTWSASGSGLFSGIGSSTNTTAAMLVGTGASLGPIGSGTITATAAPWSGLTGFPAGCTNQFIRALLSTPTCNTVNLASDVTGALSIGNVGSAGLSGTAPIVVAATEATSCPTCTATIANGTSTLGTGAISSGTCATVVTTSATGTAATDNIMADFNADPTGVTGYIPSANGMLTIIKYPTTNNVNFKVCNNTAASITPGAITLNWRVVR